MLNQIYHLQYRSPLNFSVALLAGWLICLCTPDYVSAKEPDDKKQQRKESLREMQQRAKMTRVYSLSNERTETKLITRPLFRYSDQPRGILDATLWGWGSQGRPLAVCKIEDYHGNAGGPLWVYCMASLSTGLIEVKWNNGRQFKAKKPGLELKTLRNGPVPAKTKTKRLIQIKALSRRFSSTMIDPRDKSLQEMRLLSRPIVRYSEPDRGLFDGALFGLASNGTNPDALFVIELHKSNSSRLNWKYGVTGMTAHALSVRLDDKEVWNKPFTGDPNDFDNWLFFAIPKSKDNKKPASK